MGKRSRKRSLPPVAEREAAAEPAPRVVERPAPPPPTRRARLDEAPKAPWSPFPLVELCILFGLILVVLGFVGVGGRRGVFLACGFALVSLAALELSIREHFSGYRSHSTLLAGAAAVATDAILFWTKLPQEVLLGVGIAVFAAAFYALRRAFKRRTGGMAFRA